jgi:hypothetical protein
VLPSRSRLQGWKPDSLTFTGQGVKDGGAAVDDAVTRISTNIKAMPDTKAWSGDAHNAATSMFGRAEISTNAFSEYTTAVGGALAGGAGTIGASRTALLNKADEIDMTGQLHVSNEWVVLITGGQMTAEEAAALEKRAQAEQVTVNTMLAAVGAADEATAAKLTGAAQPHGFQPPDPTGLGNLMPGMAKPPDDVPNPMSTTGLMQQAALRDIDMSQTVRDTQVETEGKVTTTTHTMQDGSRQVVVDDQEYMWDRGPTLSVTHYGKDGKFVSETRTFTYKPDSGYSVDGATKTTTRLADGTQMVAHEWPNGRATAKVYMPDGREGDIPIEFFSNPPTAITGGALTGLDTYIGQGGGIPRLSAEALDNISVGAKVAGPAVGVAEMLFNVAGAETAFERCVDAYSGTGSVVGGFAPLLVPGVGWIGAGALSIGGSQMVGAFGTFLGNQFCSR